MYEYQATLVKVIDGDTVDLSVDLGFYTTLQCRLRLVGVDTPERGKPGYQEAKEFVHATLYATHLKIRTIKHPSKSLDKYGRFLADIILPDGASLSVLLIQNNLARPYDGGAKPLDSWETVPMLVTVPPQYPGATPHAGRTGE